MAPHRTVAQIARRWSWMAACTGALLAVVLFLPARWLAGPVLSLTQDHVRLVNVQGTLWNGRADVVFSGGEGSRSQAALPAGVSWRLRPGIRPLANLRLHAPCCTEEPLRLALHLGWNRGELRWQAAQLRWPTELLTGLGTPWNTLRLDGQLDVQTPGGTLQWAGGRLRFDGQVVVQARDLSSRMATLRPLGSYQITVGAADAGAVQIELATLRGDLQMAGTGQWVGGRLRFRGEATAATGREAALANLLNIIGRREGARSVINLG